MDLPDGEGRGGPGDARGPIRTVGFAVGRDEGILTGRGRGFLLVEVLTALMVGAVVGAAVLAAERPAARTPRA